MQETEQDILETEAAETDRDQAILWARRILADETVVILDTETTGLGQEAEIVQIAVIDTAGNVLLDTLVKPQTEIPAEASRIHGITDEMVADAPAFDAVQLGIEGKTVVTYNANFDARMIRQSLAQYDKDAPAVKAYECAMETYAAYYGEWNDYFGSYKWQPLRGGDHSAKGDCLATLALIRKMAQATLACEAEDIK